MKNRFILLKCITMGALTFPTPFLIFFYLNMVYPIPNSYFGRFDIVILLVLSGGLLGIGFFYRDTAIASLKDWFPSKGN